MKTEFYITTRQVCLCGVMILMLGLLTSCQSVSSAGNTLLEHATATLEEAVANKPESTQTSQPAPTPQSDSSSDKSSDTTPQPQKKQPESSSKPSQTTDTKAVDVILQNNSSSSVDVELIDQYGGNFTASIDGGMSQNHTLRIGSDIKVNGSTVHVISADDKGKAIVVAN